MRIAVVGTGIAGLGAAWLLHRHHDVVLYERNAHIGGHANTVEVPTGRGQETVAVDTGFVVFNDWTYPNLIALLAHLGVSSVASRMSFSVSLRDPDLEYSGSGLAGLLAQPANLLRPSHVEMIRDILRFYRQAPALLRSETMDGLTLGAYLQAEGYGQAFVDRHLLPMAAAIWSAPAEQMLRFPAQSLISFFSNHGLLLLRGRPQWRTVEGGSHAYVRRMTAGLVDRVRRQCTVLSVRRTPHGVIVRDSAGDEDRFDQVVLAGHADEALRVLDRPTADERQILGAFRYQRNRAVLHHDARLMPRRRRAWASWNFLADGDRDPAARVSVTYWMNSLQGIDPAIPLFVSLNPLQEPAPTLTVGQHVYDHPVFDQRAMSAQREIGAIQGRDRVWYCGSYCGYGFHEDALASGLVVAEALGARRPWTVREASPAATNAAPWRPALPEAAE